MIGSRSVVAALALIFTTASGCQVVANLEDRSEDPVLDGCTLPAGTGDAMVRFANLVPAEGAVDVCIRSAGSSYARPVLRGGGRACPAGFTYPQMSVPFSAPSGAVDVKVVASGSTCSGETLAEALAVATPSGSTTTIAFIGHPSTGRQLHAYRDATTLSTAGTSKFRVAHAIPSGPRLVFGFANAGHLPTDLGLNLLVDPLSFGDSSRADSKVTIGRATEDGYLELPGTLLNLGVAPEGTQRAVMAQPIPLDQKARTLWAIGDPKNNAFPLRALFCEETKSVTVANVPLTDCKLSDLATLSVDIFNASLTGGRSLEEAARRPFIVNAVSGRDSDLMCIMGLGRGSDRQAVIDAAKASGHYPFSVSISTNLDTDPADPHDQNGNIPEKPTTPACGGSVNPSTVDQAFQCLLQQCSTTGTQDGVVPPATLAADGSISGGTACLSTNCAPLLIGLLGGTRDDQRCFGCLGFTASSYETHGQSRTYCTMENHDYRLFRGETPNAILSKFPIKSSESIVLPATLNQRAVHRAEVEIEPGVTVDFYCGEVSPAYGTLLPDYSAYNNGKTGGDDWFEEQKLQTQRIIDFVKQKSGTRPAIIAGDWVASKADAANGIEELNPAVIDMLDAAFTSGVPKAYVPHCTSCVAPENIYQREISTWHLKTYLFNMPKGVDTAGLFFTDSPVPLPSGKMGPISHRWGYNTRVIRP